VRRPHREVLALDKAVTHRQAGQPLIEALTAWKAPPWAVLIAPGAAEFPAL
jgi:hypothetical protein